MLITKAVTNNEGADCTRPVVSGHWPGSGIV
jgi:hypothetical protein